MSLAEWKYKCAEAASANTIICCINLVIISFTNIVLYDKLAQYNAFYILLFGLQVLVSVISYGCTSEAYEYYLRKHIGIYFTLAIGQVIYYILGLVLGYYLYFYSKGGLYQYFGISIMCFVALNTTSVLVAIVSASYYIELKLYQRPITLSASLEQDSHNFKQGVFVDLKSNQDQDLIKVIKFE